MNPVEMQEQIQRIEKKKKGKRIVNYGIYVIAFSGDATIFEESTYSVRFPFNRTRDPRTLGGYLRFHDLTATRSLDALANPAPSVQRCT